MNSIPSTIFRSETKHSGAATMADRLHTWFINNIINLTWLNQLSFWWLRRGMVADPGWYISWHSVIAMRLYDLQRQQAIIGVNADGDYTTRPLYSGAGNFEFAEPGHRNYVAHELMKLVFQIPDAVADDLHLRAYDKPVEHSNPQYRAAVTAYIDALCTRPQSIHDILRRSEDTTTNLHPVVKTDGV